MIKVKLVVLGKLKEKYLRDAQEEYAKRLSRYCDLEIEELNPVYLSEKPSAEEVSAALEREAELILKKIPRESRVIALCVEGKGMSSEALADEVLADKNAGKNICLIIGSSYGLSERVKQAADIRLSVSKMTFPHQLFRIMLLEQIYRAFKINEGSQYHK